jgi:geranylgeranyl pyrophosphate synthase
VVEPPTPPAWTRERETIERALRDLCAAHEITLGTMVSEAVRYSLLGGGKRMRGLLVMASYSTVGGQHDVSPLAAAVEVVHAYSLVHDDLPCMDDDDVRRGRPTVHRRFGVGTATAAGVAMVPLAAWAADDAAARLGLGAAVRENIITELMCASGAGGMIGGQLLDLRAEGRPLTVSELERVHRAKTGALISASVTLGAMAGGASDTTVASLRGFGDAIGLAFQIADDVLDLTGTTDTLGKPARRDLELQKSTYPAVLGLDGARLRASTLVADACESLRAADLLSPGLQSLAELVIQRSS